ncbi:hypothetical protein PoB_003371800 [Plakobranchus ocellatus]|uniref:BHLH domain-containing protein n=1 Tax=Plakobranchus ocellatus TaxID=259542 RepID=A0AAV4AKZ9_9GAST|nr:hypothetical protein PoB_003371800 [Plakobranchus ocellatus]
MSVVRKSNAPALATSDQKREQCNRRRRKYLTDGINMFEDFFKDDRCEKPEIRRNLEGQNILKEEIETAVKKMKNEKVTGIPNTPIEENTALDNQGIGSDNIT